MKKDYFIPSLMVLFISMILLRILATVSFSEAYFMKILASITGEEALIAMLIILIVLPFHLMQKLKQAINFDR